jgi:hypothetical protein
MHLIESQQINLVPSPSAFYFFFHTKQNLFVVWISDFYYFPFSRVQGGILVYEEFYILYIREFESSLSYVRLNSRRITYDE